MKFRLIPTIGFITNTGFKYLLSPQWELFKISILGNFIYIATSISLGQVKLTLITVKNC